MSVINRQSKFQNIVNYFLIKSYDIQSFLLLLKSFKYIKDLALFVMQDLTFIAAIHLACIAVCNFMQNVI